MRLADWNEAVLSFPTAGMLTTKHAAKAMIAGGRPRQHHPSAVDRCAFRPAGGRAPIAPPRRRFSISPAAPRWISRPTASASTPSRPAPWSTSCGPICARRSSEEKFVLRKDRPHYSRDDFLKSIPLGRFPRASDLAWAAVFLASDESSFLTGIDIPVDGGLRFKYPAWRPGDQTGVNIGDYVRSIHRTEYGEELAS